MQPLDEYPIDSDRPAAAPRARSERWRAWGAVAVVLIIVAALAAFFVTRRTRGPAPAEPSTAAPSAAGESAQARRPLGPDVDAREVPALDLSDPFVRELLGALSSRPELARWLATDGLIRSFVASLDTIANGGTPTATMRRLAPDRPFTVAARGDRIVIDDRSYRRYDGLADTVATLDAAGLARAYVILRPRMQEAYRELGYPEGDIDRVVERALTRLLDTPMPEGTVHVQPAPVLYQYVDPRLERLAPAQKQLIRMGPRNQQLIQAKLRDVARELGIATN